MTIPSWRRSNHEAKVEPVPAEPAHEESQHDKRCEQHRDVEQLPVDVQSLEHLVDLRELVETRECEQRLHRLRIAGLRPSP